MRRTTTVCVSALLLALAGSAGWGQEETPRRKSAEELLEMATKPAEQPARPTPHHDHLAQMAGTWTGQVRTFTGSEPRDSRSFAISEMVLGDRFLKTDYKGESMGQSLLGFALDGYDTVAGEHIGIWADSTGTSITHFRGNCDKSGKVITMYGESIDPQSGKTVKSRSITTVQSTSRYTFELATLGEDGQYVPAVRIIFSKQ